LVHLLLGCGTQAIVRGGARCASQVLHRGAQAAVRGAAQKIDRDSQAFNRGAAR
jgi:hypothetical protein